MPVYDYLCTACDHRADILHGINDEGPKFCPSCGAEGTMRKQFSAPSIHFKGSGWAKKDRGGGNSTKATAKGASSSSESSGGSNGSGESSGSSGESSGESASSSPSTPSTSTSPDAKD